MGKQKHRPADFARGQQAAGLCGAGRPGPAGRVSVSADSCTAVGYYTTRNDGDLSLIESWNGTDWSVVPSPDPSAGYNDLNSVSCTSTTACYYRPSSSRDNYAPLIESGAASA